MCLQDLGIVHKRFASKMDCSTARGRLTTGRRMPSWPTAALLAVMSLAAAEHHGQVRFGGLPVPGATVTATQGDKKFVAISDLQGVYSFPDLADGVWTMQIEMLCFSPIKQEVAIGL